MVAGLYLPQSWYLSKLTYLIQNRISKRVWLKTNIRHPKIPQSCNSSSYTADLKHILMHKCTTFSTSRLIQRFLLSARTGSTRYQKTLSKKVARVANPNTLTFLCTRFVPIAKSFFQIKDSGTQIHTLH